MAKYLKPAGETIEPAKLSVPRVCDLVEALQSSSFDYARLVECRSNGEFETVVFDVDVEVGQLRAHAIEPIERIAASFHRDDDLTPEVLALREGFPVVPHLNLRWFELPRSLCLYDERYRDLKRRWTSARFVERIREWLALTAKGRLHHGDQPLEPLLLDSIGTIVLPAGILKGGSAEPPRHLGLTATSTKPGEYFLIARESAESRVEKGLRIVASVHRGRPQEHGIIRRRPADLKQLAEFADRAGLDLRSELRDRLREWNEQAKKDAGILDALLVIIVILPKTRSAGAAVEASDVWAFFTEDPIREVGRKLGVWDISEGRIGLLLGDAPEALGEGSTVHLLNPSFRLTKDDAARLNGLPAADPVKVAAVGVGALGSQVALNLARSGFGFWKVIDDDRLLPHNLARHGLDGVLVGQNKAEAIAVVANSLVDGESLFTAIAADVLSPGEKASEVATALGEADVILDMSASVTVARHLALGVESNARRISLFLTPSGEDIVLLAEDRNRCFPLDSLEMQYYRAVANVEALSGHLSGADRRLRYGQSCRDITSEIPQELVALHAATGSRAVRKAMVTDAPCITIWRADPEGNVRRIDVLPAPAIRHSFAGWTVSTDATLVDRLATIRASKLPKETGGVLLGSFDLERRVVYIVDTVPSPPDSEEWPTLYIRGCRGLKRRVEEVGKQTEGMLEYIGEWHSHPRRCSTAPSDDDLRVFSWLTELMSADGLPALMMIVGDRGPSCYLGQMVKAENLLPEGGS